MYPDQLINVLQNLSSEKQFLFGLSLAERTSVFYELYEEEWETDMSYSDFVNAINMGYRYVLDDYQIKLSDLAQIMVTIESGIPDSDEYDGSLLVTRAQNTALSLYSSLKFALQGNIVNLVQAGERVIDIVDSIEQEGHSNYVDTDIITDREIAVQLEIMEYIEKIKLVADDIYALRRINRENSIKI